VTIGEADTQAAHPSPIHRVSGYAKGVSSGLTVFTKVTGLSYIYDDFDTVDDWVNVYGRLGVSGGATSDVVATGISYSAGYHKTQLLTDNCRAKVTIQDGTVIFGESRVVVCADNRFNRYYGVAIRRGVLSSTVSIVRGNSSISVDKYETVTVSLAAGDEFEVWYDRVNSTVRVYQNDSEIAARYFEPNDIPHGVGNRYVGVVMGTNWLVDIGPNFDDFEAFDVYEEPALVHDPVDSLTVNPGWVAVDDTIKVNPHLFAPLSLGPDGVANAAVRWTTPMNTDSVKVVVTVYRFLVGKFFLVLRSNAAMTNWVGIEFDSLQNQVYAVTGSGPTTTTRRGTLGLFFWVIPAIEFASSGVQYTATWDEDTETIRLYKGGRRTPIIEWAAGANFAGTGRYVGMMWNTTLGVTGIEPTAFDAYDVTNTAPLPPAGSGS
jgi:hypothetical protein